MTRPLILVADHNPFVRKSVREFLGELEVDVREALSGSELLDLARDFRPNVMILEKNLPGPGGRSILKTIQDENGFCDTPIIVLEERLGENQLEANAQTEKNGGAFDILSKPFERKPLVELVKRALQSPGVEKADTSPETPISSKELHSTSEKLIPEIIPVDGIDLQGVHAKQRFSEFTDTHFQYFQDFLLQKVGLHFDIKRKSDLARALENRMVALGMQNYLDYFQYLSHSLHEEKELRNLVLFLTIGETTFFRSPDQFKALREYILPQLIASRRKIPRPMLRIWSAGCSTGEEPYSIAITLREMIPDIDRWDISISATDINQKFLHFAQEGIYPPRKVRFVRDDLLHRYFIKEEGHYKIKPEISRMVKFNFHNLSTESYAHFDGTDIILCRNVLIYFRRDRIPRVIDQFKQVLAEDGYLFLGYSETLFQVSEDFKSIHYGEAFFYVRSGREQDDEEAATQEPGRYFKPQSHRTPIAAVYDQQTGRRRAFTAANSNAYNSSASILSDPTPKVKGQIRSSPVEMTGINGKEVKEVFEATTNSDIVQLWEEGLNYYFYEQFERAEEVFKQLSKNFSESAKAQLGLGFIHANRGEDSLAREKIDMALHIDKLLPEAYFLRALLEEKSGNIETAMADYRNVILLDPDFAMAHFNLGILYMKLNRTRDCRREFHNTLNILKGYDINHNIRFSGGLHREALMQLCEDLSE